ncbi:MAG: hypothetical protein MJK10_09255 [Pseudomonadales bacterium]|nr:hypothetical protein [Pseudomonadales bacterium]NRA16231.1 hypothetical protein [Oceanospirillaceae bacterium]
MTLSNTAICLVLSTLLVVPAEAKKGQSDKADKSERAEKSDKSNKPNKSAKARKNYGSTKPKALPAGLKKKLERGETLPPGWQTKLAAGQVIGTAILSNADSISPVAEDGSVLVDIQGIKLKIDRESNQLLELLTDQ